MWLYTGFTVSAKINALIYMCHTSRQGRPTAVIYIDTDEVCEDTNPTVDFSLGQRSAQRECGAEITTKGTTLRSIEFQVPNAAFLILS